MFSQGSSLSATRHMTNSRLTVLACIDDKKRPAALNLTPNRSASTDSSSSGSSLKPPRTPRFAEATSVHSPVEAPLSPFAPHERSEMAQSQPGDIGFGYINNRESVNVPMTPKTPLKSAMRVPGTPARKFENPMSPTFKEEEFLDKRESHTSKAQRRDLVRLCYYHAGRASSPANSSTEDKNSSPNGQVCSSRCQLQLCPYHHLDAVCLLLDFQRNKIAASSEWSACLVGEEQDLASDSDSRRGRHLTARMHHCFRCLL